MKQMPAYPILIIPAPLEAILASSPDLPPEPHLPAPVKPAAPQMAEQPEMPAPPKTPKGRFTNSIWAASVSFAAVTALAEPIEAIILSIVVAYSLYDATAGHQKRLEQYEQRLQFYKDAELPNWKENLRKWEEEKNVYALSGRTSAIKFKKSGKKKSRQ